jgi:hypothetical protein
MGTTDYTATERQRRFRTRRKLERLNAVAIELPSECPITELDTDCPVVSTVDLRPLFDGGRS